MGKSRKGVKRGGGILNTIIDKLPISLHVQAIITVVRALNN